MRSCFIFVMYRAFGGFLFFLKIPGFFKLATSLLKPRRFKSSVLLSTNFKTLFDFISHVIHDRIVSPKTAVINMSCLLKHASHFERKWPKVAFASPTPDKTPIPTACFDLKGEGVFMAKRSCFSSKQVCAESHLRAWNRARHEIERYKRRACLVAEESICRAAL